MNLKDGQWQIGDVKFGKGTSISLVNVEAIGYEVSVGDRPMPMSDQIRFTKDYVQPGVIQFQMAVLDNYLLENMLDSSVDPEALGVVPGHELLEKLKWEWRADSIRTAWGGVKPLTYTVGTIHRMLYGRPRNFAAGRIKTRAGWYPVTASYQLADGVSYSKETFSRLISPTGTGVLGGSITRDPDALAPTWPVITIVGPITNPVVEIGNKTITISHSISSGQGIELNTRPWERRAITSTGLNIGAKLTSSVYLEDLRLPEKADNLGIALHGSGTSGATKMLVQWQEAYHAI